MEMKCFQMVGKRGAFLKKMKVFGKTFCGEITQICGRNGNILLAGFNGREQLVWWVGGNDHV